MTVKINGKHFPRRFEMKVAEKKRGGKKLKTSVRNKKAGKTAKLKCTLTSTTTTKTYGYKAVRRQDVCHTNTGLQKECIKYRANKAGNFCDLSK